MRKEILNTAVQEAREQTRAALQLVYDSLNRGQQNKLLKDKTVVQLLERYEVKL